MPLPDDVVLSDGAVAQFQYNPRSRYKMVKYNDSLRVVEGEIMRDTATLIPRPLYYDQQTRNGVEMRKIV